MNQPQPLDFQGDIRSFFGGVPFAPLVGFSGKTKQPSFSNVFLSWSRRGWCWSGFIEHELYNLLPFTYYIFSVQAGRCWKSGKIWSNFCVQRWMLKKQWNSEALWNSFNMNQSNQVPHLLFLSMFGLHICEFSTLTVNPNCFLGAISQGGHSDVVGKPSRHGTWMVGLIVANDATYTMVPRCYELLLPS